MLYLLQSVPFPLFLLLRFFFFPSFLDDFFASLLPLPSLPSPSSRFHPLSCFASFFKRRSRYVRLSPSSLSSPSFPPTSALAHFLSPSLPPQHPLFPSLISSSSQCQSSRLLLSLLTLLYLLPILLSDLCLVPSPPSSCPLPPPSQNPLPVSQAGLFTLE